MGLCRGGDRLHGRTQHRQCRHARHCHPVGVEEQITRKGGYLAYESTDRKTLYYTLSENGSEGLYAKSLPDGVEVQAMKEQVVGRGLAVFPDGVYYLHAVAPGICEIRWGARGEYTARAKAGDFIHVPAFLPHMEINPSDSEPFHWVVVRSTSTPIVVNLPEHTWP